LAIKQNYFQICIQQNF